MHAVATEFGFLPISLNVQTEKIAVSDLPNLEESIASLGSSEHVHGDWIYAPQRRSKDFISQKTTVLPYPSRVFGLVKTHTIEHADADGTDHIGFLLWCLGFFFGVRLSSNQAGFLDATPIKQHKLTDFIVRHSQAAEWLSLAEDFWQRHKSEKRSVKRLEGIINSLFIAQNPNHLPFERFLYLYMALDGCFALTKSS